MLLYFNWTHIQGQSHQGEHTLHYAAVTIFETEINAII